MARTSAEKRLAKVLHAERGAEQTLNKCCPPDGEKYSRGILGVMFGRRAPNSTKTGTMLTRFGPNRANFGRNRANRPKLGQCWSNLAPGAPKSLPKYHHEHLPSIFPGAAPRPVGPAAFVQGLSPFGGQQVGERAYFVDTLRSTLNRTCPRSWAPRHIPKACRLREHPYGVFGAWI